MTTPEDSPTTFPPPAPAPAAAAPAGPWDGVAETFARDYLRDRRSERRWRVFFRLAWLLLFAAVVWSALSARGRSAAPAGPHTALIEVRGEIAADARRAPRTCSPA